MYLFSISEYAMTIVLDFTHSYNRDNKKVYSNHLFTSIVNDIIYIYNNVRI